MTPRQAELARHALGAQLYRRGFTRPYRNHFCAAAGSANDKSWAAMVKNGDARILNTDGLGIADTVYAVTDEGQAKALAGLSWGPRAKWSRGTPWRLTDFERKVLGVSE